MEYTATVFFFKKHDTWIGYTVNVKWSILTKEY